MLKLKQEPECPLRCPLGKNVVPHTLQLMQSCNVNMLMLMLEAKAPAWAVNCQRAASFSHVGLFDIRQNRTSEKRT